MTIDYRSDTFTKPTPQMMEAMCHAEVGDDVFGEDPSINSLEAKAAEIFGMESGLFCPSGTMTNQIAIKCHTQPGEEVICDSLSHVYIYEGGGIAFNSGCQVKPLNGDRGRITASMVLSAINPIDIHKAPSRLVSVENTANRGGGSCYQFSDLQDIKEVCRAHGMKFHLDGARIFNALVATGESPRNLGGLFDSISVCLSKGLGAPVGSVLLGNAEFIARARRVRKVFGGGMRQAGFLAAAGLYALTHHVKRLEDDHRRAKEIEKALGEKHFIGNILPVQTNIIIFEVLPPYHASKIVEAFKKEDILVMGISETQIRMVLHLDITQEMVEKTLRLIESL